MTRKGKTYRLCQELFNKLFDIETELEKLPLTEVELKETAHQIRSVQKKLVDIRGRPDKI